MTIPTSTTDMPMTRQEYDAEIKAIRETFDKYGRSPRELTWLAIQPYLESQGYLLNPRYRPDWVPSWIQRGWTMDKAMIRCLGDTHMMSVRQFIVSKSHHSNFLTSTLAMSWTL